MHGFTNLKYSNFILLTVILLCSSTASLKAQIQQSFDDVAALQAAGWIFESYSDNSTNNDSWLQGDGNIFPAHSGADSSYIASSSAGINNYVCNWLIMPDLGYTDQLSFYTRSIANSKLFPVIRLLVMYSPSGDTTTSDCGSSPTLGSGDFVPLLEINPNQELFVFPVDWTQFTVDVKGSGRIAFLFYVDGISAEAFDSGYFGIDSVSRGSTSPPPVQSVPSLNIIGLLSLIMVMMVAVYITRKNSFSNTQNGEHS